ncbi:hypothetical protein [Polymorphospora lycopeni]|uniref:Uncharacterized protein n=1 Tax=Polymorphospora lycopeni TaxID=3140240 RepID=A0ABV5D054_9ACTN
MPAISPVVSPRFGRACATPTWYGARAVTAGSAPSTTWTPAR